MKKSIICITLLLTGLTSCKEENPETPVYDNTRTSVQSDSISTSGITLDFEDTTLTEDIEDIVYHSEEWEDSPIDVDI